jgi:hypothetical protein
MVSNVELLVSVRTGQGRQFASIQELENGYIQKALSLMISSAKILLLVLLQLVHPDFAPGRPGSFPHPNSPLTFM